MAATNASRRYDTTVLAELLELSTVTRRRDILEIDSQRPHADGTHNYLFIYRLSVICLKKTTR